MLASWLANSLAHTVNTSIFKKRKVGSYYSLLYKLSPHTVTVVFICRIINPNPGSTRGLVTESRPVGKKPRRHPTWILPFVFSFKHTDFNLVGVEFRRHVVAELSSAWTGEGVGWTRTRDDRLLLHLHHLKWKRKRTKRPVEWVNIGPRTIARSPRD